MYNERNYEEEIARRDREELEHIKSEQELNDLSKDSLKQDLEIISIEIFELMEKIERAQNMRGLDEDTKKYAVSGFKRKLKEAQEVKDTISEVLSGVKKDKESLDRKEEQNINRQEATKKHEENKKRIEAERQKKIDDANASLEREELMLQFIKSNEDAFNNYKRTHDLSAVAEKYGAEFEEFVKNSKKEVQEPVVQSVVEEPEQAPVEIPVVETPSAVSEEQSSSSDKDDFAVIDELRDVDQKDTLVVGPDITLDELSKENKDQTENNEGLLPGGVPEIPEVEEVEKPEDLLANLGPIPEIPEVPELDIEKPEDLLPGGVLEPSKEGSDVNFEVKKHSKVVSIIEHTKGLIKELVDTKRGRAIAALIAIGGATAVIATGPVGFTAVGAAIQGVGSAATIAGGGVLSAAAANEFNKCKKM